MYHWSARPLSKCLIERSRVCSSIPSVTAADEDFVLAGNLVAVVAPNPLAGLEIDSAGESAVPVVSKTDAAADSDAADDAVGPVAVEVDVGGIC